MKNKREILINANRICIFRTDRIGDMVLTLPMVNALKQINPNAEIHFIISKYTEPLLKGQPLIGNYYFIEEIINLEIFLKKMNFDVVFFPRPKFYEILATFRARIPLRVGSAYRLYSILLNHRVKEHRKYGTKSEAEHNLNLISSITGKQYELKLIPPIIDPQLLQNLREKFNLPEKFVLVHPGGGGSAPKLPIYKFKEIASMIANKYNIKIVVTGNEHETELTNLICQNIENSINLCNKISLEQLIAVIYLSEGIIANSTGVIHIAASFDKKIIGFYPNSPRMNSIRWGPISSKKIILSPEYNKKKDIDNMELIPLDKIEMAFRTLFIS